MSNKKSINILVAIIGVLLMLLAGAIGYIFGNKLPESGDNSKTTSIVDDAKVMKEIEELKAMYDSKIEDKTNSYKALQDEKDRVQSLVLELEKTKNDANSLLKYKTEYKNLESKMKVLVNEIVVLKSKKNKVAPKIIDKPKALVTEQTPTKNIVTKTEVAAKKETPVVTKAETPSPKSDGFFNKVATTKEETPIVKKEVPVVKKETPVVKYSKVTMSNVKSGAYISKSASKQIETNVSGRADLIKITFTLDENPNAKAGEKMYYFQIINSRNNVLGKRITEFFDDESLTYSFKKSFDYDNQSVQITQEFPYADFEKGVYFINIFDRNELVGKSSFTLK